MTTDELSITAQEYEQPLAVSHSQLSFSLYGELIKSKQTFLLVYTAIFAYLISAWTTTGINLSQLLWVTVGLFFAISGSTLLNMVIDRDIDALMVRTKDRPIPSGRMPVSTALKHGLLFTLAGILSVGIFINIVTMFVVFLGFFFDVVVYSIWLKRRTKYSIIFGGIAGGLPAIAGRAAVIGTIDIVSITMALFVLCWIPLHILTLALIPKNLKGYKDAKVPMWPVVSSKEQTIRVISISAILSASAIILTGIFLEIYLLLLFPLIVFCSYVILQSLANLNQPSDQRTFKLFKLASMFMAIAFLWLFIGIILSFYETCPLRIFLW
ncbi:MAG: heme o synthase [Candidatus Hodarchaeales archaeon]|jgi:protoheme IX farnesyltransferase